MNSGKIGADGWTGIEGSTRGPRGPKNDTLLIVDFDFPSQSGGSGL